MASVPYSAPLRCTRCGVNINKKPRAKTPKFCPPCRHQQQSDWKRQLRKNAAGGRSG